MRAAYQVDERVQSGVWSGQVGSRSLQSTIHKAYLLARHLYALYCLLQRNLAGNLNPSVDDPPLSPSFSNKMPGIFTDPGWELLSTSILSTSNCGNPALRLFGFGPVAADGYGIGYIIKEDGLSVCVFLSLSSSSDFILTP